MLFFRKGLLLALTVLVLDQLSKLWALNELATSRIDIIPGFFEFVLVQNFGVAFGMLNEVGSGWKDYFLITVAIVAVLVLTYMLYRCQRILEAITFSLVIGGAIGNVIDRIRLGWVVDFIHVHWHDLSWPVFNIADSAISVGICLILLDNLRRDDKRTD